VALVDYGCMEQLSRLSHKDLILWQKAMDLAVRARPSGQHSYSKK